MRRVFTRGLLTIVALGATQLYLCASQDGKIDVNKYKNRSSKPDGTIMAMMPGEDWEPTRVPVSYPIYTEGYLVSGTAEGIMASGYKPVEKIATGVVLGSRTPIPIASLVPGGWTPEGWEVVGNFRWHFTNNSFTTPMVQIKFVYHHGYNTTTDWWSAQPFPSLNYNGRIVNHFGPKSVDQGGNFIQYSCPIYTFDVPDYYRPAATQVLQKTNHSWWPDTGKSYLEQVELWSSLPSQQSTKSVYFERFIPISEFSNEIKVAIPGTDLVVNGAHFIENTTNFTNISIVKHTQITTGHTWITLAELENEYSGNLETFKQNMSNTMSIRATPWPAYRAKQSSSTQIGGANYATIATEMAPE